MYLPGVLRPLGRLARHLREVHVTSGWRLVGPWLYSPFGVVQLTFFPLEKFV